MNKIKKADRPLVSVIIPVYNTAAYLKRCLDSVAGQTYRNLEVLLVDDGSVDGSREILERYAEKDNRFKVFHQEHKGQSEARNLALSKAEGGWLAFADSDDRCMPEMIELLMETALSEKVQACWGGHFFHTAQYRAVVREHVPPGVYRGGGLLYWFYTDGRRISSLCTGVFRKELFEGLRFPAGRIHEDTWMLPRLFGRADSAACIDIPVYHYYQRKDGSCNGSSVKRQMDMLWVYDEIISYVSIHSPECRGYAQRDRLEKMSILLDQIDRGGRKRYPKCWRRAEEAFRDAADQMEGAALYHRGACLLFCLSPVLFVKICRIYCFMTYSLKCWVSKHF